MSFYSKGKHTAAIPYKLFHENRRRLVEALKQKDRKVGPKSAVLLEGGDDAYLYDADIPYCTVFRQVSDTIPAGGT